MHAISSYRGSRPTNTQTHTNTQTGPITIHCAAASLARSVKMALTYHTVKFSVKLSLINSFKHVIRQS